MSVRTATEKKITAVITALLLAGALAFAWARGRHVESAGGAGPAQAPTEGAAAPGRSVYTEECGLCHGSAAARAEVGRLADELYRPQPDGALLVDFLLHGSADGEHPPFDHLSDELVAALLAYLLAYGDGDVASGARPVITTQDVAARRAGR